LKLQVDISSYYDGKNDSELQVVPFRRLVATSLPQGGIIWCGCRKAIPSKSVIVKVEKNDKTLSATGTRFAGEFCRSTCNLEKTAYQ
jgi:hypothetical protein